MKRTLTYLLALFEGTGLTLLGFGVIALGPLFVMKSLGAEPPAHIDYRELQKSVSVIDMNVEDPQGKRLGSVEDLALDVENGRVVEVIVSSGGFLGFGQKTVAVPPGALTFDPTNEVLRLNMNRETFKAAPGFELSQWRQHCQSQRVAEDYLYYGQKPYFVANGQGSASGNTASEPLGYIQLCSKLTSLPIKNLQNEPLGEVYDFLFALLSGRSTIIGNSSITHVIIRSPGLLRVKHVVQARGLRFNAAHDALYLDVTTQAFNSEPRFEWSHGNNYPWSNAFKNAPHLFGDSGHFHQETYSNATVAANNGVNTRQNVQEGGAATYTPLEQGTGFRDVAKTYTIYAAIQADTNLSQNAQNVEVGTINGRTTLRGHVNTDGGKRAIGAIAAKAGQGLPENVSNLLEVRPLAVAK